MVLVGALNIEKSAIVRAIHSGKPEVNIYPITMHGVTLGHLWFFWESEQEVMYRNVASVSIPSKRQLIQERLVKGRKDEKKKKNDSNDVREEKRQLDGKGDEGLGGVDAIRIDNDDNDAGWGDIQEGVPHRRVALPSSSSNGSNADSDQIFPISQLCHIMDSPGVLRCDNSRPQNEMEELMLEAMSHLPTAVMYAMDLSSGAGDKCLSMEDQLVLRTIPLQALDQCGVEGQPGHREQVRERLVRILEEEGRVQEQRVERGSGGGEAASADMHFIKLSVKEGTGMEELRQEVMRVLGKVQVVLDPMSALDKRSTHAL